MADEKVGYVDGSTPTEFVGRVEHETEDAILLGDGTVVRPLVRLAHRVQNLEEGIANSGDDEDRHGWLEGRFEAKQRAFNDHEDMTGLQKGWLSKSQLVHVIRRVPR